MYLKSTQHIYFDFVLISEWSLINVPGTIIGVGPNKLLVVKGLSMAYNVQCEIS